LVKYVTAGDLQLGGVGVGENNRAMRAVSQCPHYPLGLGDILHNIVMPI